MSVRTRVVKIFDDTGPSLDRFGLVLALSMLSVVILALVDLAEATESFRSKLGWLSVTLIVGVTLIVVLRTTGVARRPRRIAGAVVWVTIGSVFVVTFLDSWSFFDAGAVAERPSVVWAAVAIVSPVLVLRRVVMQRVVTRDTLFGAIAVYVLLAIAFNYAFLATQDLGGLEFFGETQPTTSFMYFSLSSLTTVGYGDLVAVTAPGRLLASTESVFGQILLVTVVARLVSLLSATPTRAAQRSTENVE